MSDSTYLCTSDKPYSYPSSSEEGYESKLKTISLETWVIPLFYKISGYVIAVVLLTACEADRNGQRTSSIDQLKDKLQSDYQKLALMRAEESLKDYPLFLTHRIDPDSRLSLSTADNRTPPYLWKVIRKDGGPEREFWRNGRVVTYYRDSWQIKVQPDGKATVTNKPEQIRTDYLNKKRERPKLF